MIERMMKILGMRLNMMNKTPLFVCFDIVHHHLFSECPGFVQFKETMTIVNLVLRLQTASS